MSYNTHVLKPYEFVGIVNGYLVFASLIYQILETLFLLIIITQRVDQILVAILTSRINKCDIEHEYGSNIRTTYSIYYQLHCNILQRYEHFAFIRTTLRLVFICVTIPFVLSRRYYNKLFSSIDNMRHYSLTCYNIMRYQTLNCYIIDTA